MPRKRKKPLDLSIRYANALAIPEKEAGRAGGVATTLGSISESIARQRAEALLKQTAAGKPASSLGPQERSLLGTTLQTKHEGGGGLLHDILNPILTAGDTVKNLGADVWSLGTHALPGAIHTAESAGKTLQEHPEALISPWTLLGKSTPFSRDVIRPTIEQYKFTYGGKVPKSLLKGARTPAERTKIEKAFKQKEGGSFLERFQKHPLGPLLDVGSVVSLGAGTAVRGAGLAGRVGAKLGAADTAATARGVAKAVGGGKRAPIEIKSGISPQHIATPDHPDVEAVLPRRIERSYSPSANRRIFQKLILDPLIERSQGGKLGRMTQPVGKKLVGRYENRVMRLTERKYNALARAAGMEAGPQKALGALRHMESRLPPAESIALHLRLRGINDAQTAMAFQERVRQGLDNPQLLKSLFPTGDVPMDYIRMMANLTPDVIQRIEQPTSEMIGAADLYTSIQQDVRSLLGVTEEFDQSRAYAPLRSLLGDEAPDVAALQQLYQDEPIHPAYVEDIPPLSYSYRTSRLRGAIPGLSSGESKLRSPQRIPYATDPNPQNVVREPFQAYILPNELKAFRSGMFRTDPGVLSDSLRRMYQDVTQKGFGQDMLDRVGLKDEAGELRRFNNQGELDRTVGRAGTHVLVNPELTVRFFTAEMNVMEEVIDRMKMIEPTERQQQMLDVLNQELAHNAEAFVTEYLSAVKPGGVGIPRAVYNEIRDNFKAQQPIETAPFRQIIWLQNKWRTWTLAYMARWFINTAAGTAFMNVIKGVWHPKYYEMALRHSLTPDSTLVTYLPEKLKQKFEVPELPAGARLGPAVGVHEATETGYAPTFPTKKLFSAAQQIEDFFRTASFYHSLEGQAKQALREEAQVLGEYRTPLNSLKLQDDFVELAMSNKDWTDKAIDDVNRFAYNYNLLSGTERRYIRAAVPFWGWYRFVTKFMWRLPIEYPARTNIMRWLGDIGLEQEQELGSIPPWARGSIILNVVGRNEMAKLLPTRGLNPLSGFANPGSQEYGPVGGLVNPGQLSPFLQAGASALGFNSQTGDLVPVGPELPVGYDFFRNPINLKTGQETSIMQHGGGRRFVGGLLRSVPQIRLGEQALQGGRPVYPESIPLIDEHPMDVADTTRKPTGALNLFAQTAGISPRTIQPAHYQRLLRKRVQYAEAEHKRRLRKSRG